MCFGSSRRAPERGLQKQRLIAEAGLLITAVLPDFHEYEGAESIGSRSALYVLEKTPQTRALLAADAGAGSGPLYTRRTPNPEGTKQARSKFKQRPRVGARELDGAAQEQREALLGIRGVGEQRAEAPAQRGRERLPRVEMRGLDGEALLRAACAQEAQQRVVHVQHVHAA